MDRYLKAWHHFIGARLMPIQHFSDVYKERAVILFAFKIGRSIDVGSMIHDTIKQSFQNVHANLYCPFIITILWRHAEVRWTDTEKLLQPMYIINDSTITAMSSWDDNPSARAIFVGASFSRDTRRCWLRVSPIREVLETLVSLYFYIEDNVVLKCGRKECRT